MTPFMQLFWGFLIVLVDFRINGFDLLIDLVGYIFIVIGLGVLAKRSGQFERARPFAIGLLVLSVLSEISSIDVTTSRHRFLDVVTVTPTGAEGRNIVTFWSAGLVVLLGLAALIANLLLVFYICEGIKEMAGRSGELAEKAKQRWLSFLWAQLAGFAVLAIVFASESVAVGLLILVVLANIIAAILIADLLLRANKAFYPSGT
jgi:hypothetical protein